MKEFCQNQFCENPGAKEVLVSSSMELLMPKLTDLNSKTMTARALGLLEEARNLIQKAIEGRIHDQVSGKRPSPDCPCARMVRDIEAFLAQCPKALCAEGRPVRNSPLRIIALEVTCMAADAKDVSKSLFDPDSTQPSWY